MILPGFQPRTSLSHRGFTESSIDSTQDQFRFSGTAELYAEHNISVAIQVMFHELFNRQYKKKKEGVKEDKIDCCETAFNSIYFSFITHNIRIQAKWVRMAEDTLIKKNHFPLKRYLTIFFTAFKESFTIFHVNYINRRIYISKAMMN